MKNNEQSGFILMIIIMIVVAVFIIGLAIYRINQANTTPEPARETDQSVHFG